ncbi:hypothetical protein CHUAL_005673 [Chamberlinius hualienensis]
MKMESTIPAVESSSSPLTNAEEITVTTSDQYKDYVPTTNKREKCPVVITPVANLQPSSSSKIKNTHGVFTISTNQNQSPTNISPILHQTDPGDETTQRQQDDTTYTSTSSVLPHSANESSTKPQIKDSVHDGVAQTKDSMYQHIDVIKNNDENEYSSKDLLETNSDKTTQAEVSKCRTCDQNENLSQEKVVPQGGNDESIEDIDQTTSNKRIPEKTFTQMSDNVSENLTLKPDEVEKVTQNQQAPFLANISSETLRYKSESSTSQSLYDVKTIESIEDVKYAEDIELMSVSHMKKLLNKAFVNHSDLTERREFVSKLQEVWKDIQKSTTVDGSVCQICFSNPLNSVFLECGHMIACVDCASKIKECPICRFYISRVVRVFQI